MAAISVDARRRTRPSVRTCCGTLLVPVNARCTADSAALRQAARCSRTTSSIRSVRSFKLVVVVMRLQSHATSPASTGALNGYQRTGCADPAAVVRRSKKNARTDKAPAQGTGWFDCRRSDVFDQVDTQVDPSRCACASGEPHQGLEDASCG